MPEPFTLIDAGTIIETEASVNAEGVTLPAGPAVLGWELKDEGLCQGDVCVPVRDRAALRAGEGIDLAEFARLLGRPLAVDADERVAALADAPADRGAQLASLEAPDFTLPDLDGNLHSLSDHRGKKVLLIAYASW